MNAIEMIAAERQRQVESEGWTAEYDAEHPGDLALAAASYALPDELREREFIRYVGPRRFGPPRFWPWAERFWKPTPDDRIRELVKAGALIAAEIDRLSTAKEATKHE